MVRISAVLIVRDEASRLPACLNAIRGVVDEIVVVDTGSCDDTPGVARRYTSLVMSFGWCDDFSAARNFALKHATGDWVFSLDADEEVLESGRARDLLARFASTHEASTIGTIELHSPTGPGPDSLVVVDHLPRFFERTAWRYEGAIHEQLTSKSGAARISSTGVRAWHSGYAQLPGDPKHKARRNIPLLLKELIQSPDDEYLLYQLGKAHFSLGQFDEAAAALTQALETMSFDTAEKVPSGRRGPVARPVLTDLTVTLAYARVNTNAPAAARDLLEYHASLGHPGTQRADFWHALGYVYLVLGDIARARRAYERSLSFGTACEDVLGTGSYGSEYHLGLIEEARGHLDLALEHYAAALRYKADYRPVIVRLVDWIVEYSRAPEKAIVEAMDVAAFRSVYVEKLRVLDAQGDREAVRRLAASAPLFGVQRDSAH